MADFTFNEINQQLPFSLEAEQSVLGSLLLEPSILSTIGEQINYECFYKQQHKEIYSIMIHLFTLGTPIDIVTVLNEAISRKVFDTKEDAKVYLVGLMEQVPTTANVESYCRIIKEKFYMRSLISSSREIIGYASEGDGDAATLLDIAEQRIFDIRKGKDVEGLIPISSIVADVYEHLGELAGDDKDKHTGLKSGFTLLDTMLTGLNKSDLILLAARPGVGKTSFALNIATNVAVKHQLPVAIFQLEMAKEQLVSRILSSEARVPSQSLRTGNITGDEWNRLASAANLIYDMPIHIDDTAGITVQQIKGKLRRVKNLGLVVIDYLQLLSSGKKTDSRVNEVSEMTRSLKIMAKELNVPVILLSQLSRASESRTEHRPMLSDLRESGSIEQDADIVIFLYDDSKYNPDTEAINIVECIIGKNRHGETGKFELAWDGQFTRFSNLERHRE